MKKKDRDLGPKHVDYFIWHSITSEPYAQWVLMFFRLPAIQQLRWAQFFGDAKLFCTHENKRYRVTGASRFGDIWLQEDFTKDCGYQHRVDVNACSNWSDSP